MDTKQIPIKASDEDVKGVYANGMTLWSSEEEFCLDFISAFPPVGALTARVITSPGHLKRMVDLLSNALKKYEAEHGEVVPAEEPETSKIGFGKPE